MSFLTFLATDRPFPETDLRTWREIQMGENRIGLLMGFEVEPYQPASKLHDDYGLEVEKPFCSTVSLTDDSQCVEAARRYLEENLKTGEAVELWNVWVGTAPGPEPVNTAGMRHIDAARTPEVFEEVVCGLERWHWKVKTIHSAEWEPELVKEFLACDAVRITIMK